MLNEYCTLVRGGVNSHKPRLQINEPETAESSSKIMTLPVCSGSCPVVTHVQFLLKLTRSDSKTADLHLLKLELSVGSVKNTQPRYNSHIPFRSIRMSITSICWHTGGLIRGVGAHQETASSLGF